MARQNPIRIGKRVPVLAGTTDSGDVLESDTLLNQWVVIYFYPRDSTPGCTSEAVDFGKLAPRFRKLGCTILGVSRDSVASHARFREKHALSFSLIADTDETWCNAFDVIHEKVLYGKRHLGVVRSTFLIDPEGVLRAEWRGVKVTGHAQAVLDALMDARKNAG
ncbi:MAG: peroxiredoxin [Dokdonella sp.]|jgi:peroxiredoxin Q/BCP|uniref:peroxiredoxin n=1 Tax=Dokdonella sp. TaxID=2291710 RepID=UPI0025B8B889|nr:peroxiredoxin [Dokdonella sp.]MBK8124849.1 peroxiredoxin [Dokdonella sp.]HNV07611.1 peroxiredoxin [Dokdonella sp.]HPW04636.1 peroxiredoxin [Dokdonella sp.]